MDKRCNTCNALMYEKSIKTGKKEWGCPCCLVIYSEGSSKPKTYPKLENEAGDDLYYEEWIVSQDTADYLLATFSECLLETSPESKFKFWTNRQLKKDYYKNDEEI